MERLITSISYTVLNYLLILFAKHNNLDSLPMSICEVGSYNFVQANYLWLYYNAIKYQFVVMRSNTKTRNRSENHKSVLKAQLNKILRLRNY